MDSTYSNSDFIAIYLKINEYINNYSLAEKLIIILPAYFLSEGCINLLAKLFFRSKNDREIYKLAYRYFTSGLLVVIAVFLLLVPTLEFAFYKMNNENVGDLVIYFLAFTPLCQAINFAQASWNHQIISGRFTRLKFVFLPFFSLIISVGIVVLLSLVYVEYLLSFNRSKLFLSSPTSTTSLRLEPIDWAQTVKIYSRLKYASDDSTVHVHCWVYFKNNGSKDYLIDTNNLYVSIAMNKPVLLKPKGYVAEINTAYLSQSSYIALQPNDSYICLMKGELTIGQIKSLRKDPFLKVEYVASPHYPDESNHILEELQIIFY